MSQLLLPFWLVCLVAFSGSIATRCAGDRVLPLVNSQPRTSAWSVTALPAPSAPIHSQDQNRNQPGGFSPAPNLRFDRLSAADDLCFGHSTARPTPPTRAARGQGRLCPIVEDTAGVLWVGTSRQLNRYEPPSDTFTRLFSDTSLLSLLVDRQDGIWLGKVHISSILSKLGVATRAEAISLALREKLAR